VHRTVKALEEGDVVWAREALGTLRGYTSSEWAERFDSFVEALKEDA
jgi:hypothetical protein